MTQFLNNEVATKILKTFGPTSQVFRNSTPEKLNDDFETYLSDRNWDGSFEEFINQNLQAEIQQIESYGTPADKKNNKKLATNLRNRVRAMKLPKGFETGLRKLIAERKAEAAKPAPAASNGKSNGSTAKTKAPVGPQVGDEKLATEADFTNPSHAELSDYVYHAMVDKQGRVVGRGFLARVGDGKKRRWFALRNEEQTALWQTSNWDIRQIDFATYQKLTLAYFAKNGWIEWKTLQAEMKQKPAETSATETADTAQ